MYVNKYWYIETEDRRDAWILVIEALALGVRLNRIEELVKKWNLTKEDLKEYIIRNPEPTSLQKEGMNKFIQLILNLDPNTFWDGLTRKR